MTRLSGSWLSWLSGSWRSFLYSYSVYSCHLFLISSTSVRSIPFLSFIEHIFAWNFPLVSLIFLKRSLVFPILLFSSLSFHWSLRKAFFSLLAILWNFAFKWEYLSLSPLLFASLFSQLFVNICRRTLFSGPWFYASTIMGLDFFGLSPFLFHHRCMVTTVAEKGTMSPFSKFVSLPGPFQVFVKGWGSLTWRERTSFKANVLFL